MKNSVSNDSADVNAEIKLCFIFVIKARKSPSTMYLNVHVFDC